jgi:hypothetical protein
LKLRGLRLEVMKLGGVSRHAVGLQGVRLLAAMVSAFAGEF